MELHHRCFIVGDLQSLALATRHTSPELMGIKGVEPLILLRRRSLNPKCIPFPPYALILLKKLPIKFYIGTICKKLQFFIG